MALLILVATAGCAEPDFQLSDGQDRRFVDYENQWLVINYWAEWCAPCRKEIPELNALAAAGTAQVLGVNFDGLTGIALKTARAQMQIEFEVMEGDPAERWLQSRPKVLPTTFIINPAGKLTQVLVGPQTQEDFTLAVQATIVDTTDITDSDMH